VSTGLIFGAQLLYISTAPDLFFDAYQIERTFPLYFAGLATAMGLASFLNARLVQHFGMRAMVRAGLTGLTGLSLIMMIASLINAGDLHLLVLLALLFGAFFAIGILFGNLNALAMQTLGQTAGLGASLIASGSSAIATVFAVGTGSLYGGNAMYLAFGFLLASASALLLTEAAMRGDEAPIEAAR